MTTPPPQKVTPSPAPPAAAEAAVRAELERRTLALRGAREGIFDWDLQANTVHLSARAAELLGLEPQPREIGPAEWLERVAPEDRAALHQATSAHLRGDAERVNVEHRVAQAGPEAPELRACERSRTYADSATPLEMSVFRHPYCG